MRARVEIENSYVSELTHDGQFIMKQTMEVALLEVLLDIRELLQTNDTRSKELMEIIKRQAASISEMNAKVSDD